jgi:CBS-domain-containing membrane protein
MRSFVTPLRSDVYPRRFALGEELHRHIRTFTARHEPAGAFASHAKSGAGAFIGIGAVGALSAFSGLPLLIAPLGATAVLLFGHPSSPLAQPMNIFGGYLLATVLGAVAALMFPGHWMLAAAAVGASIALMLALRVTHPPAGAVPLVALTAPLESATLFPTILIACVSLVALALVHHRLPPRVQYPRPPVLDHLLPPPGQHLVASAPEAEQAAS